MPCLSQPTGPSGQKCSIRLKALFEPALLLQDQPDRVIGSKVNSDLIDLGSNRAGRSPKQPLRLRWLEKRGAKCC